MSRADKRIGTRWATIIAFVLDLAEAYRAVAADESREREATEWVDNLAGNIAREPG